MSLYFLKACEMLNTGGYEVAYLIDLFQEVKLFTLLFHFMVHVYHLCIHYCTIMISYTPIFISFESNIY